MSDDLPPFLYCQWWWGLQRSCGVDDPEIYDGAHVGVQLIGRRLQEEKVLAITEYVAGVLTN